MKCVHCINKAIITNYDMPMCAFHNNEFKTNVKGEQMKEFLCPDCKRKLMKVEDAEDEEGSICKLEFPYYHCPFCQQDYNLENLEEDQLE